jgi:hypothetical protein
MSQQITRRSIVLLLCTLAPGASSAAPILTFNESTGGSAGRSNQSVGWKFNVLSPIVVNGLGWYDENNDGLSLSHLVSIWNPTGVLLASVTIPAGAVAPLDGQFRTSPITPLTLAAGAGYIVGGVDSVLDTERLACGGAGVCLGSMIQTVDPRIAYVNATFGTALGGRRSSRNRLKAFMVQAFPSCQSQMRYSCC